MCICVGEYPTFGGFLTAILATWQQIKAWIMEPVHVDATIINSCAHCFWWLWINLALLEVFQKAYRLIMKSPTCLVDDILNPRWHSFAI
jgi:hypothetical protein